MRLTNRLIIATYWVSSKLCVCGAIICIFLAGKQAGLGAHDLAVWTILGFALGAFVFGKVLAAFGREYRSACRLSRGIVDIPRA